jgi:hypothetical protein
MKKNLISAEFEMNTSNILCDEGPDLIKENFSGIQATDKLKNYKLMKLIAGEVISNRGVV